MLAPVEQIRLLFDEAPVGMVVCSVDGAVLRANDAFGAMLGRLPSEIIGQSLAELVVRDDVWASEGRPSLLDATSDSHTMETRFLRSDGTIATGLVTLRAGADDDGTRLVVAHVLDISARKEIERRLRYEAFHDRMTGLPNRALLLDRLGQALLKDQRGAVIAVGLDRLRSINDAFGHTQGDRVVVEVARRLAAAAPRGDTVARIGGDEFVVLATSDWDPSVVGALSAAAQPRMAPDGRELNVTASIGVRTLQGLEAPELVLGDALLALQRAKQLGRNRVVHFEPSLRGRASRVAEIARNLRDALARGAIRVDYQPLHTVSDERLAGFEALVRWRSSPLGPISPAEFVPVAETHGQILLIGAHVLREALAQLAEWREQSPSAEPLFVSVNLSPVQVREPGHVDELRAMILASGVPPDRLKIEITESVFIDLTDEATRALADLQATGVQLVLDDFGTGYSSLNHLRELPFDGLKVDRAFVQRAIEDDRSRSLVATMASLARGLSMHSTAEGVETEAQRDFVRSVGFDFFQGFLFGRPQPPNAIALP